MVLKGAVIIVWATIVVEHLYGHWTAWFKNEPEASYGGNSASQAIDRLLDASDRESYDMKQMYPISEQTRDGHLEFMIRFLGDAEFGKPLTL